MGHIATPWTTGPLHLLTASLVATLLALTMTAADASVVSAACKVKNVTRGGTFNSLAGAVKAARNRNTLTVRGTCFGSTDITNKKLTIVGKWTRRYGPPTLRGNGRQAVLEVGGDFAKVTLKELTIEAKPNRTLRRSGGGIINGSPSLTLVNVRVKDFKTRERGGGIYNYDGNVWLLGTTKVVNNKATGSGGGIYNNSGKVVLGNKALVASNRASQGAGVGSDGPLAVLVVKGSATIRSNTATGYGGGGIGASDGVVTLSGNARVSGNTATQYGGGFAGSGVLTLNDTSSITGNTAPVGGGIKSDGDITMSDQSTVTGNTAGVYAGGIDHNFGQLSGVVCHPQPNPNVFGNSPDDCNLD